MHTHTAPVSGARMTSRRIPGHTVIELHGELDIASTAALRGGLLATLNGASTSAVIDLSGVSFCDAAGLSLLVAARRRARLRNLSLTLAAPRPQVAKLLRITGLHTAFTVRTTPFEPLAHRVPAPQPAGV